MKGVVFLGDRRCETREFPEPEPGPGEITLRIMATGICGSDLSVYRGPYASDQIRGHEPCGVVVKVGPGVKRLKEGDRVTVHHHQGCGACRECAHGEFVACTGGKRLHGVDIPGSFAEYMNAAERTCVPLPESASFLDGAFLACVGTTAYAALRRLDARAWETVAVFGLGPVGLSAAVMAKTMGCLVVGMDVRPHRLELARRCGADAVVDGRGEKPAAEIAAAVRTLAGSHAAGADMVVETSGSTAARRLIIPTLRRGGRAAIVGVGSAEEVVNPSHIHGKACRLVGSVVFPIGWLWDAADLLCASRASFEPAVTHRFPLDAAAEALQTADEAKGGKVVFEPHGPSSVSEK